MSDASVPLVDRRPWIGQVSAPVLAAALGVFGALARWRGADAPNYLFRWELFKRAGFTLWNLAWYSGHHTPGYSVLLPPLMAWFTPPVVGIAAVTLAAWSFDHILRALPGTTARRRVLASLLFAAGTCTNLAVGRLAFAVGLAIALAAAVAGLHGRRGLALVLSPLATLASPVAGMFLVLGWVAWWLVARHRWLVGATAAALVPSIALAIAFPEGGHFPFRGGHFTVVVLACALAVWALPFEARAVRVGAGLYLLAGAAVFFVPNPMGGNMARLAMYVAAPLFVACARLRLRALVPVVAVLIWWQWSPAIDGMFRSGRDPSTSAAYYTDLVEYLKSRPEHVDRIEIPFTRRHFEATYVASEVPLARGWERQLDMKTNSIFYEPTLDAATYHRWLDETGVELVALPDAELDPSAVAEAAIVRSQPPFLRPVWSDPHWQVFEVVGSTGIVSGPARLVAQDVDTIELQATAPGEVLLRQHWMDYWAIEGPACVEPSPFDDWVHIQVSAPGRLLLRPALTGERAHCSPGG